MIINDSVLRSDEKIALSLRSLYSENGYSPFKMSKFEEYDLYMQNKDFLISEGIITFNDPNGKLMALKPDVTLSIIKNGRDEPGRVQKLYYTENVYRISDSSHNYKEIMQTGLECIGDITTDDTVQVVHLAMESAARISENHRIAISHIGFSECYLKEQGAANKAIAKAISEKNADQLKTICTPQQLPSLLVLLKTYADAASLQEAVLPYCHEADTLSTLRDFCALWNKLFSEGCETACIDLSMANTTGYYSGIVFKCYISGIAVPVISGGQYDGLMKKLGRKSHAVGFAVYLDELERMDSSIPKAEIPMINVALPKGRLGEKVYSLFARAGYDCPEILEENRKLVFENPEKHIRYFWVKPSDVAIYVARGAADMGVAGSDILMEYEPEVYELCDLGLGKCRMAVAAKADFVDDGTKTLRVATKFSHIAQSYYTQQCRDIDIIHLNGSIELAPILGLSDVIVDIVETGKTLLENGLEPRETIVPVSARLIANKVSYQFKKDIMESIRLSIAKQVEV